MALIASLLLGVVAGLRTFTAPAVLWLTRHAGPVAYVLGVFALLEYAGDLHPKAPSRTAPAPLAARIISGGFCGWVICTAAGAPAIAGAVLGICGALLGAFGGLAVRLAVSKLIGKVPAALVEDAVAAAGGAAIVGMLTR